ncbi:toprim domain-containing protein [Dyadobacter chenhuakuii]|uniref:Toprim domain-containing protein n=1 Tax=Dyadobacter chenhuakuii TaxID=2909339 RepID=A0ABY4XIZ0_9BACT|nr:toprim domain-containing protein [Dyadobacter chenhuakuii]MCF2496116.1 toprim domain-containing protein [Dyadobacter chenhuakuii]USJ30180.1 toprim domain-containing protein [Dyadobacter chenhuakuii]
MTCEQARENSIVELLQNCNIHPHYVRGQDHWYLSPLRDEKTPSFKVNAKLNLYYDHGSGQGGDIIDLGRQLFQCDTKALLQKLGSEHLLFHPQQSVERNAYIDRNVTPETKQSAIQITSTKDLDSNVAISQYLQNRGIDLSIAREYCKEVYYQVGDKSYYAAGFENRSGGYELRSSHFKGSSSPKDITHINSGHKSVCVLEGFMDFLSLLTLRKHMPVQSDFLVLNSVSLADRSLDILKDYRTAFIYPDRDEAGKKLMEKYQDAGLNCVDSSGIYHNHKDLNELLMASKSPEKQIKKQQIFKKSGGLHL